MDTPPGFRNLCAPSRHSGDSSLSPNDPNSSETSTSAGSGGSTDRMSLEMTVTKSLHPSASTSD